MCVCYACQLDLTGFLSLQNLAQTEEMEAHGMDDDRVSTWNAAIVTKTEGITCPNVPPAPNDAPECTLNSVGLNPSPPSPVTGEDGGR